MSFLRRFGEGKESEPRILQAQLALAGQSVYSTRFTSPAWSLVVAVLCSVGAFGHVSLARTLFLPIAVAVAVGASSQMAVAYERYCDTEGDAYSWFPCFVAMQIAVSAAWGVMPWLCWEAGNPVNHMFLAASMMAVIAALVVGRGSNMDMYVASLAPISLMTAVRSLPICIVHRRHGDRGAGAFHCAAVVAYRTPLVVRMDEDSRLRFKVEDMARELEKARDEALKKRFEAETGQRFQDPPFWPI